MIPVDNINSHNVEPNRSNNSSKRVSPSPKQKEPSTRLTPSNSTLPSDDTIPTLDINKRVIAVANTIDSLLKKLSGLQTRLKSNPNREDIIADIKATEESITSAQITFQNMISISALNSENNRQISDIHTFDKVAQQLELNRESILQILQV